jgi:hypothetical protein
MVLRKIKDEALISSLAGAKVLSILIVVRVGVYFGLAP